MPEMSVSEFAANVGEIMPVITREFYKRQTTGFYKLKITMPQFVVMDMLSRQQESRMSDLAHFMNVTTAAMTGIIDRLVRDGYVRRSSDPTDRRIVKVALTPKGDKIVIHMLGERVKLVEDIFSVISDNERTEYLNIIRHIRDHIMETSH